MRESWTCFYNLPKMTRNKNEDKKNPHHWRCRWLLIDHVLLVTWTKDFVCTWRHFWIKIQTYTSRDVPSSILTGRFWWNHKQDKLHTQNLNQCMAMSSSLASQVSRLAKELLKKYLNSNHNSLMWLLSLSKTCFIYQSSFQPSYLIKNRCSPAATERQTL